MKELDLDTLETIVGGVAMPWQSGTQNLGAGGAGAPTAPAAAPPRTFASSAGGGGVSMPWQSGQHNIGPWAKNPGW